jgi:uncharacterized protein YyaL (SSP411 family)
MPNRLADETSPYLRQHADNPVEWYPWGQEAFDAARAADRPILLSIGYSACHWCHVMAHESFENEDTAAVMNSLFVNVKVDREERPDVDAIYMEVVTALTGHGGWPMTVFLTPDGEAFFGGTYFPPTRRGGMPSFLDVCAAIDDAWTNRRDEVTEQATHITAALTEAAATEAGDLPTDDTFAAALVQMHRQYDERWGGFGSAPKFPQAMGLELLLRRTRPNEDHLPIVVNCLDAMASGGIYDHLGGGFARYSVDEEWLVPHFEKMLYDNALLARVYLHAWQITGEPRFRQVLDETIGYVLRDLTHPGGGFYSAEDADSEGEEGKFYVWTEAQIRAVLGNGPDTDAALAWWGVDQGPNFEHGTNILHRPARGDLIRPGNIEGARIGLLAARDARVRPGLDDKVLTEWNALFLASLAEAARVTGDPAWADAAVRNGEFLLAHLRREDGRWLRSWQAGGGARHLAYAVDYGALLDAFVRLAELTGEARWITEARSVAAGLVELFWDDEHGGVFTTGNDADALITRPKDVSDNATPSANALAAFGLLRLSALTGDEELRARAEAILRLLTPLASRNALFFAHGLAAADLWAAGSTEIVVVGDRPDLLAEVNRRYLPRAVLAWGEPYDSPLWADRAEGRAYVCEGFTCQLPATTPEELAAQLG